MKVENTSTACYWVLLPFKPHQTGALRTPSHEGGDLDQSRGRSSCVSAFASGTDALLHNERIIASSSTTDTLLMERGHPGNFLFSWS